MKVAWGGIFYSCTVVVVRQSALKVHYINWGAEFDEWLPFPSNKVVLDTIEIRAGPRQSLASQGKPKEGDRLKVAPLYDH